MSIINDALKKTQDNLEKKEPKDMSEVYAKLHGESPAAPEGSKNTSQKPTPAKENKKKTSSNLSQYLILLVLLIGIGFVIKNYYPQLIPRQLSFNLNFKKIFNQVRSSSSPTFRPFSPQKKTAQPPINANSIVLQGTLAREGKNVALLNDRIYESGESINGKTIVNITLKKVDIKDGDRIVSLTVGETLP